MSAGEEQQNHLYRLPGAVSIAIGGDTQAFRGRRQLESGNDWAIHRKILGQLFYCNRSMREREHDLPGMGVALMGREVRRVPQARPATKQCDETMGSGALAHLSTCKYLILAIYPPEHTATFDAKPSGLVYVPLELEWKG